MELIPESVLITIMANLVLFMFATTCYIAQEAGTVERIAWSRVGFALGLSFLVLLGCTIGRYIL